MGRGGAAWPNGPGAPAPHGPNRPTKGNPMFSLWKGGKTYLFGREEFTSNSSSWMAPLGGFWLPQTDLPSYIRRRRGKGEVHLELCLAWPPLHPSRSPHNPVPGSRRSPAGSSPPLPPPRRRAAGRREEIYITTSAARWNEEGKDGIDSVRATEDGSDAGTLHRFDRLHQQRA